MQTHEYFLPEKAVLPVADGALDTYMNAPLAPAFDTVLPSGARQMNNPFGRFELQPSEVCPKNFIIFDQTKQESRIMFHPTMAYKFSSPGFHVNAANAQDFQRKKGDQMERELSPFEEDTNDIDALLSLDVDEPEDLDDEEVSTARTHENYESTSDTCSSYQPRLTKNRLSSPYVHKSSGTRSYCKDERKHQEMKRMVKILRRIVPGGGNQMDSVAVLDEAVKYLKSLKVEVEQFGVAP